MIWKIAHDAEILDITAFGDFFVKNADNSCDFYHVSEGEKNDVTELIDEYGLPPVNIDLGADWYQLDAVAALTEAGWQWNDKQCLGFVQPLFQGGCYEQDNIAVVDFFDYQKQLAASITL